jgi:hypothetical protein
MPHLRLRNLLHTPNRDKTPIFSFDNLLPTAPDLQHPHKKFRKIKDSPSKTIALPPTQALINIATATGGHVSDRIGALR